MANLAATTVTGVLQATGAPTAGTPNSVIRWSDIFDSSGRLLVSLLPLQGWGYNPGEGKWHKITIEDIDGALTQVIDPTPYATPS